LEEERPSFPLVGEKEHREKRRSDLPGQGKKKEKFSARRGNQGALSFPVERKGRFSSPSTESKFPNIKKEKVHVPPRRRVKFEEKRRKKAAL